MYCNQCGFKNSQGTQYCINDGAPLTAISESVQVNREPMKYCQSCSHENGSTAIYCMSCGTSLEKTKEKQEHKVNISSQSRQGENHSLPGGSGQSFLSNLLHPQRLVHSAIYCGISLAALLVISIIISSRINTYFLDMLSSEFYMDAAELGSAFKLISFTDIFMLSHMTSVSYVANSVMFSGYLESTSGLFLLIIIPAIVFIIVGFLLNRSEADRSMGQRLTQVLSLSIMYSVIVGIISLFAGVSFEYSDPSGFLGDISLSADYSFIESVFNAFVISFLFLTVGAMIGLAKGQRFNNEAYSLSIARAILSAVVGLFALMVIGLGISFTSEALEYEEDSLKLIVGSQLGGYLWNVAQFESIQLQVADWEESIEASYSLLGGAKATEDEEGFKETINEVISGSIWLIILVPVALHFWAGNQLRKATKGNMLVELAVYSVVFGLINAVFVTISRLSFSTSFSDFYSFSLGFSTFGTFIISGIMAFVVSYVAVMLTNRQTEQLYEHNQSA
ncbi:zinc ribbon domain-containing protein [Bacillus suaedae]|uniref:Zinc ribbon domain-containing protein n=1 Tax=Halalkalibacter suaedae TaxID=2822140 RepID=A0A940WXS0_9BACI|nr:zinc ribbon domain-containing protein [Bacillus suaedae]MBP3950241.1 zinc ribbon domain-containing protein [Bacillus suaedae]